MLGSATWEQPLPRSLVLAGAGWALCLGLRGILIHQILDQESDSAAKVRTFASRLSSEVVRSFVLKVILPLEAACLIVFLALLAPFSKMLIAAGLLFAAGEASRVLRGVPLPIVYPKQPGRERHVPLLKNDFHEVWLPCALAGQLTFDHPGYLWLVAVHVLLFHEGIMEVATLMTRFGRQLSRKVWSSS